MVLSMPKMRRLRENYRRIKHITIVFAILMIAIGIGTFSVPQSGSVFAAWLMVVGVLLRSLYDFFLYFRMPGDLRDGWNLASAVIWLAILIFLVVNNTCASLTAKLVPWGSMDMVIAILIGFSSILSGIKILCTMGIFRSIGKNALGCMLGGILAILAGIAVLTCPIGSLLKLSFVYSLFLVIGGLSLFCRALSF